MCRTKTKQKRVVPLCNKYDELLFIFIFCTIIIRECGCAGCILLLINFTSHGILLTGHGEAIYLVSDALNEQRDANTHRVRLWCEPREKHFVYIGHEWQCILMDTFQFYIFKLSYHFQMNDFQREYRMEEFSQFGIWLLIRPHGEAESVGRWLRSHWLQVCEQLRHPFHIPQKRKNLRSQSR